MQTTPTENSMTSRIMTIAALLAVLTSACFSQDTQPSPEASESARQKLIASLSFQDGAVTLANGIATLNLPPEFRYLDPKDAATVLEKLWGNPPGGESLGMLVPATPSLADKGSWAVLITYDEDGYVKDDDAEKIDYTKLMKQMQEAVAGANKEREQEGYEPVELVGWAATPAYDKEARKLYWAKELKFGNDPEHTLNYNIRALGRRGVLVLNAIAGMDQLQEIQTATPRILSMVSYNPGHRYEDFDSKSDQVATYGIAALVAGGIAAKAGFFKGILIALLAAKKLVIVAVIAIGIWIKKLFDRRKSDAEKTLRQ